MGEETLYLDPAIQHLDPAIHYITAIDVPYTVPYTLVLYGPVNKQVTLNLFTDL